MSIKTPETRVYSHQIIKDRNSIHLFNLVRKMAPISRADLSRISGLSPATVTVLMEELLKRKWIRELAPVVTPGVRGRRPIQLEVNAAAGYVATLELLDRGYICGLYDICQNKIKEIRCKDSNPDVSAICETMKKLVSLRSERRLLGVHVLYPGLFDAENGHLGFSAVIPAENTFRSDLMDALRDSLPPCHIMISNTSTAMAYSVFASHAPNIAVPLLALSIYEGINAGIVTDAQTCLPLEAGHIIIQRDGPSCMCGNRGCLETLCSTPALFRMINDKTDLNLTYEDVYGAECNQAAIAAVAEAFRRGDPAVMEVMEKFAYSLCCGIVSIVNLFAVKSVYIGGAISPLGTPFADLLSKTLREQFCILTNGGQVTIDLFDDDLEASRKAAVMLTTDAVFHQD